MFIDNNGATDWAILNIMDCGASKPGDLCTGIGTTIQDGPFMGADISFDGVVVTTIPLPAASWLFWTGILVLAGTSKRKQAAYKLHNMSVSWPRAPASHSPEHDTDTKFGNWTRNLLPGGTPAACTH